MADLAIFKHDAEFAFARAAIVADGGDIFDAFARKRLNQIVGETRAAKSTKHNARAIANIRDSRVQTIHNFIGHRALEIAELVLPVDCSRHGEFVQPRQLVKTGRGKIIRTIPESSGAKAQFILRRLCQG